LSLIASLSQRIWGKSKPAERRKPQNAANSNLAGVRHSIESLPGIAQAHPDLAKYHRIGRIRQQTLHGLTSR